MAKAVLLLSGGLDSATVGAIARDRGREIYALSFSYDQRHAVELEAARKVADHLKVVEHQIVAIPAGLFAGSSLLRPGQVDTHPVPKQRTNAAMAVGIPSTYVPARNMLFLSYAVAWAESLGAQEIFLGVNSVDYSGYPDCRPEFLNAFGNAANLGTKTGLDPTTRFKIVAPLLTKSKVEIVQWGNDLNVDFSLTHSCYDPQPDHWDCGIRYLACGTCDSCTIRLDAFRLAKLRDPVAYLPSLNLLGS